MLALIMAGGLGKRLRPITDKVPKPLVKVGGKPIIYWQIKWFESFGIDRFVLLGGYRAGMLVRYIKSIGYADRFDFSVEKEPLGTAGAIKNASGLLGGEDSFFVSNGDNVTDQDLGRIRLRGRYKCCISLVPYRSSAGIARFRGDRVTRFDEKPLIAGCWINAGATLLSSEVLGMLPRKGSLEQDVFPVLSRKGMLSCVKFTDCYFNSVNTVKDCDDIDRDFREGRIRFGP